MSYLTAQVGAASTAEAISSTTDEVCTAAIEATLLTAGLIAGLTVVLNGVAALAALSGLSTGSDAV